MLTVHNIQTALDALAPPALAESWDNVGLLVGDARQAVRTALIALDASVEVLEQATAQSAELLITHHPLVFSGIKRLVDDGGTVALACRLVREGRALLAAHTNLDAAPDGLNSYVADLLGLRDVRPLLPTEARALLKLVVYVPETHVDAVRAAICAAGAGQIGHYGECTFGAPGTGTFRPEEGTHPYLGTAGALERVPEIRLETVVPTAALRSVLAALETSHPYEEVAYDLFRLENAWPNAGLGRIGQLAAPTTAGDFLATVQAVLGTDRLALVGERQRPVQRVALCTGAGGDFLDRAWRAGADLYLTGEVKHHQALVAAQRGLAVIDAGHFATERPAVALLADYLAAQLPELNIIRAVECDPLQR
ncbi:MAG TPA: Nif3-like dinuclear metal center hexameric protein [Armatimonadota bacterium]